jgi:hypothetical protein
MRATQFVVERKMGCPDKQGNDERGLLSRK